MTLVWGQISLNFFDSVVICEGAPSTARTSLFIFSIKRAYSPWEMSPPTNLSISLQFTLLIVISRPSGEFSSSNDICICVNMMVADLCKAHTLQVRILICY